MNGGVREVAIRSRYYEVCDWKFRNGMVASKPGTYERGDARM
jgi:hypothetical protein